MTRVFKMRLHDFNTERLFLTLGTARPRATESEGEKKESIFLHVFQKSTDYHDRPTVDLGSC